VANGQILAIGLLLIILGFIAYITPLNVTLAENATVNLSIPKVVAFCDSGLGQFAQISYEVVLVCSEFKNFLIGIYGAGLIGIILLIIGVTKSDKKNDEGHEEKVVAKEEKKETYQEILKQTFTKEEKPKEDFESSFIAVREYGKGKKPPRSLRKSPILKGVVIGIIASSIIWGASLAATNQVFVMTGDAMEPTIMKGDIIRYTKTPFKEISVNDIIAYTDAQDPSRVLVHNVVGVTNPKIIEVKNEESPVVHNVREAQYIGKINSIESWGALSVFMNPLTLLVLIPAAFVTPIVIMKISGSRKSKNS